MITTHITEKELQMFAAEPENNLAFVPNHALAQKMARELLVLRRASEQLTEVARAALEYIDALPSETVAALPAMPGFSRDWAEDVLNGLSGEEHE